MKHSVLCKLHFDEKYIIRGEKCNLKWSLIPILTNHAKELLQLPKGRPPYSAAMIRYALHLRYTSFQAYKQLLDRFSLTSINVLNRIQQGGVDSVKALKILHEQGKISMDCVLMVDEMYLQKATHYHSGEYVGAK